MQAIRTRTKGPTDHNGQRVIATAEAGRITVPWDHSLDHYNNHLHAARALADKLDWRMPQYSWRGGMLPDGSRAWVTFHVPSAKVEWR